ncbi:MAG: hypothetical protein RSD39_02490 [Oscillospiraceae bacterium]
MPKDSKKNDAPDIDRAGAKLNVFFRLMCAVLAFAFSALWLKSMFLGAAAAFLAVGHIAVTVFAKRQQKK